MWEFEAVVVRVPVEPDLLAWARERSKVSREDLLGRFPRLVEWESGDVQPTLRQLEDYGRATHTPLGFLLLPEPPTESVPIPDFRTVADSPVGRPSADLLDTIYICQQRQDWYRDFARITREEPVPFVGTLTEQVPATSAADAIRDVLDFSLDDRTQYPSWSAALSGLVEHTESAGVLVMISGIVGSNTHRKLDPQEFRGFSLIDSLAPIVFINGSDTKAAQIFTLAHEIAHVWLGKAGLDDASLGGQPTNAVERWCNQVAAELLVPIAEFRSRFDDNAGLTEELERLARIFRVSTLVVLRRVYDDQRLSWTQFQSAFQEERNRVIALMERTGTGGGNFYNTTPVRTSKRFARAILTSANEGQTLYRDAARLLGFKKLATLEELGHHLGVA